MHYIIIIAFFLVSAVMCFYIAKSRKANTTFWLAMGIAFGPLAIPFAFFSRPRTNQ